MPHVSLDATPPNLPGISPDFAARLSAKDLEDIAAGDIPGKTVQAIEAAAVAREAEDLKEFFKSAPPSWSTTPGYPVPRPRWRLRRSRRPSPGTALTHGRPYGRRSRTTPFWPPSCPTGSARWTPYPSGAAKLAVLKDKRVVRQGTFSGAQEVKAAL
jgi:hypothetical protein